MGCFRIICLMSSLLSLFASGSANNHSIHCLLCLLAAHVVGSRK